jgi:hypothetical protein
MSNLVTRKYLISIFVVFISIITIVNIGKISPVLGTNISNSIHSDEEIRTTIEKVISKKEFIKKEDKFYDKLLEAIQKFLNKLNIEKENELPWNQIQNSNENSYLNILKRGFIMVLIITIIIFTLFLIYKNFFKLKKVRVVIDSNNEDIITVYNDSSILYKKAEEYYDNSDFKNGIRYLYLALLVNLDNRNIIILNKGKTNREYLLEIDSKGEFLYDNFQKFTNFFNLVLYGKKNIIDGINKEDEFQYWKRQYKLMTEVNHIER